MSTTVVITLRGTGNVDTTDLESRFAQVHPGMEPSPVYHLRSNSTDQQEHNTHEPPVATPSSVLGLGLARKFKILPSKPTPTPGVNSLARGKATEQIRESVEPKTSQVPLKERNLLGGSLKASMLDTYYERDILLGTPPRAIETGDLSIRPSCSNPLCRIHEKGLKPSMALRCLKTRLRIETRAMRELEEHREAERLRDEEILKAVERETYTPAEIAIKAVGGRRLPRRPGFGEKKHSLLKNVVTAEDLEKEEGARKEREKHWNETLERQLKDESDNSDCEENLAALARMS